jgi:hypothetical protein
MLMAPKLMLSLALGFCAARQGRAGDWPQFLGRTRDEVYAGSDFTTVWPKEVPPGVWQKNIGQGFSGPTAQDGRLIPFPDLRL